MITVTNKDNYLTIEGHADPVVCASVSTLVYTCHNMMITHDTESIVFKDYKEIGTGHDKIEIFLKKYDKVTDLIWTIICQELQELSIQYPQSVAYYD